LVRDEVQFHLSSLSLLFSEFDVVCVTLQMEVVIKQQVPLIQQASGPPWIVGIGTIIDSATAISNTSLGLNLSQCLVYFEATQV